MARRKLANAVARAAVATAQRQFGHRDGVVSVHWGVRYAKGRRTRVGCVVVFVRNKRPLHLLDQRQHAPSVVTFRFRKQTKRVPLDIQAVGPAGTIHTISSVEAGNDARVVLDSASSVPEGTLSAVATDQTGRRAILSGHVAKSVGREVWANAVDGTQIALGSVAKVVNDKAMDIAWTDPLSDGDSLGRPTPDFRDPEPADVNTKVWVLVPWDFRGAPAFITGIDATAVFSSGGQETTMSGLVALSRAVTNPGDSGAPVIDSNTELIGFVVGIQGGRTFLVPSRRALNALEQP